jgi:hypothetical protein
MEDTMSNQNGPSDDGQLVRIPRSVLEDRILGAWVGKSYGAAMGEPLEFAFNGRVFLGAVDVQEHALRTWLVNEDDLYMNMANLAVVADKGLDASSEDFAIPYREGKFLVWHANGQARQNVLAGIPAELAGHPFYNPHADDIDFQIECDYIGMISPGLPEAAQDLCRRQGRVVNYGDGIYGGMFFTAMYAAAWFETDPRRIVELGRQAIPADSRYGLLIDHLLACHRDHPDDWMAAWRAIEGKWNHDLCPWGPTEPGGKFNIQASFNGAYVALGVLYSGGDYYRAIEITTRAGQDTDSNTANTGGIMGTLTGYEGLPERVRREMWPYLNRIYNHTRYSIVSAADECVRLAIANVVANGGQERGSDVLVRRQPFRHDAPAEVSFPDLKPMDTFAATDARLTWRGQWARHGQGEPLMRSDTPGDALEVSFRGNVIFVQGDIHYTCGVMEAWVDGEMVQERDLYHPKQWDNACQCTAVWVTGLADGEHRLEVRVTGRKNPAAEGVGITLGRVVSYAGRVAELPQA